MGEHALRDLAGDLSRWWHELGGLLASRRLLASLHGETGRLTPTKLRALDVLAESGGLRLGELAQRVGVEETTATRMVDRLETLGLVHRSASAADRRVTVVTLTARGEEVVAVMEEQRRAFFADVLIALDPEEREELVRLSAKAAALVRSRSEELARG